MPPKKSSAAKAPPRPKITLEFELKDFQTLVASCFDPDPRRPLVSPGPFLRSNKPGQRKANEQPFDWKPGREPKGDKAFALLFVRVKRMALQDEPPGENWVALRGPNYSPACALGAICQNSYADAAKRLKWMGEFCGFAGHKCSLAEYLKQDNFDQAKGDASRQEKATIKFNAVAFPPDNIRIRVWDGKKSRPATDGEVRKIERALHGLKDWNEAKDEIEPPERWQADDALNDDLASNTPPPDAAARPQPAPAPAGPVSVHQTIHAQPGSHVTTIGVQNVLPAALAPDQITRRLDDVRRGHRQILDKLGQSRPAPRPPFDVLHLLKPIRAGVLIGRDGPRDELVARLRRGEDACVWGPAGYGKTALAADALRVAIGETDDDLARSPFPDGVVFLDLYALHAVPERIWTQLADRFALGADTQSPPRERATRACLNRRALVVVEGAEEAGDGATLGNLLSVLGPAMRRLVLTRNVAQDATGHALRLDQELSSADAFELLKLVSQRRASEAQLREIVTLLGGHPLALTHAGCQLAQPADSPAAFLAELRAAPLELHAPGNEREKLRWLYDRSARLISDDARRVLAGVGRLAYAPFTLGAAVAALPAERGVHAASTSDDTGTVKRPEGRAPEAGAGAGRAREALRQLVRHGFLTPPGDDECWQFTHALAYRYAAERAVSSTPRGSRREEAQNKGDQSLVTSAATAELSLRLAGWVVAEWAASLAPFKAPGEKTAAHVRRVEDVLAHAAALLAAEAPPAHAIALRLLEVQDPLPEPGQTVLLRPHLAEMIGLLYERLKPALAQGSAPAQAQLAGLSGNYANWLGEVGRRAEALAPAQEAVELRRALAGQNPDAFGPALASSLNTLANRLSQAGRRAEALAPAQEAVKLHRRLAGQNPDAFGPALALTLNTLANRLSQAGRRAEALAPAQEAVRWYRALARQNPDAFGPALAVSLNNLAGHLSAVGQRAEALAPAQEAVKLRRALARENPDAFGPYLAGSLNNLATALSDVGRRAEALAPAQEAVDLRRALAGQNPDAFAEGLAKSLWTLSLVFTGLERHGEAAAALAEGIRGLQPQFTRLPEAFAPLMAGLGQDYVQAASAAQLEPDPALLAPVLEARARWQTP